MVRKVGGFTFQELNLTIDDIKRDRRGRRRPVLRLRQPARLPPRAGHRRHRVPAADAAHLACELGVDPASLVHALQNHDELTYELVHFVDAPHATTCSRYRGEEITGARARRARSARDLCERPHRRRPRPTTCVFTTNGIACTTATVIAAALGHRRPRHDRPTTSVERIKQAHLLLAMFNALQPGVFALSGLGPVRDADARRRPRSPT